MATAYEKRTDIHRRGVFQPKFYRFVGWYYLGFVWRNAWREGVRAAMARKAAGS
jgi:hypothetical protein